MTQQEAQTKEIGGHRYTVMMLDPLSAEDLLITVVNVIGPSLGIAAGVVADAATGGKTDDTLLDSKIPPGAIEGAISSFCQRVNKIQMREVIALLTPVTTVEIAGKTPGLDRIFSEHFRGRLGKLNEWLMFAIKVQLGDFFDSAAPGIEGGLRLVRDAATPPRNSQSTTDAPPE